MSKILDPEPHYLEIVNWQPENPDQLEAFELTMMSYISPASHIHVIGHAVWTPEGYESVKRIVGPNSLENVTRCDMIVRMVGEDTAKAKGQKWWEVRTADPVRWDDTSHREYSLERYTELKHEVAEKLSARLNVKLLPADTLFLNCDSSEAEQKIKEAGKPWLSFASDW
jgi:hypothetical protein